MEYLVAAFVAFLVVAFVVGKLWERTESYQQHLHYKQAVRNAKRGIRPILED